MRKNSHIRLVILSLSFSVSSSSGPRKSTNDLTVRTIRARKGRKQTITSPWIISYLSQKVREAELVGTFLQPNTRGGEAKGILNSRGTGNWATHTVQPLPRPPPPHIHTQGEWGGGADDDKEKR